MTLAAYEFGREVQYVATLREYLDGARLNRSRMRLLRPWRMSCARRWPPYQTR